MFKSLQLSTLYLYLSYNIKTNNMNRIEQMHKLQQKANDLLDVIQASEYKMEIQKQNLKSACDIESEYLIAKTIQAMKTTERAQERLIYSYKKVLNKIIEL